MSFTTFNPDIALDQYTLANLRRLASNSDLPGRSQFTNKEALYNALSKAFKAGKYKAGSNLRLQGAKLGEYDPKLGDEYYTISQLKEFAKRLGLKNRTSLRSKAKLRQALDNYYLKSTPGTRGRLYSKRKVFQPSLGITGYTKDELYQLAKSLGGKRNMNKQQLFNLLKGTAKSPVRPSLVSMTVKELIEEAKKRKLSGYSGKNRDQLLALLGAQKGPSPVKKAPTPKRKSPSPVKKAPTPKRKSPSPVKKAPTPKRKSPSPVKKAPTPAKKSKRRVASPVLESPKKASPKKASPKRTYRDLNLKQLQAEAKARLITGYSKMNRAQLEVALMAYNSAQKK